VRLTTTAASIATVSTDQLFSPPALWVARDSTRHHTATAPVQHVTPTHTTNSDVLHVSIALDAHILTFPTVTACTQLPTPPRTYPILQEHTAWHTA